MNCSRLALPLMLLIGIPAADATLVPEPVAHFTFDNTIARTVAPNDGSTSTSTGVSFVPGVLGEAASFSSASSRISLDNAPSIDALSDEFSVSFWTRSANGGILIDKDIIGTRSDDWFIASQGTDGRVYMSVGNQRTFGEGAISDDKWHHIAVTRDQSAGEVSVYVDGTLGQTATRADLFNDIANPSPLNIGAWEKGSPNNFANGFSGLIDELQFFDQKLGAEQVEKLYESVAIGERNGPAEITFGEAAGESMRWFVTHDTDAADIPSENYADSRNVHLSGDGESLTLSVTKNSIGQWVGAQIQAARSEEFGPGDYRFELKTDPSQLNGHLVLGTFLIESADVGRRDVVDANVAEEDREEIDIEFTRWLGYDNPDLNNHNLHYTFHERDNGVPQGASSPFVAPEFQGPFPFREVTTERTSHLISWRPDGITFESRLGGIGEGGTIIYSDTCSFADGSGSPCDSLTPPGGRNGLVPIINLWVHSDDGEDGKYEGGLSESDLREVTLSGFSYQAASPDGANLDYERGGLEWVAGGAGTVDYTQIQQEFGTSAVLTTGSPVFLEQKLATPATPWVLTFDAAFLSGNGLLDVLLDDELLLQVDGSLIAGNGFNTYSAFVDTAALLGLQQGKLRFLFDGTTGLQLALDNVSILSATSNQVAIRAPEPAAWALMCMGIFGLLLRGKRRLRM